MHLKIIKTLLSNNDELYDIVTGKDQGTKIEGSTINSDFMFENIIRRADRDIRLSQIFSATKAFQSIETTKIEKKEIKRFEKILVKQLLNKYKGLDSQALQEKHAIPLNKIHQIEEIQSLIDRQKRMPESIELVENAKVTLSQLPEIVSKFKKNSDLLDELNDAINDVASKNEPKQLEFYSHAPLDVQEFILSALPINPEHAHDLMETAVKNRCKLFISLHESTEAKGKCNQFWESKIVLDKGIDGSKIVEIASRILKTGKNQNENGKIPELIETTLTLDDGRKITHIRYENWIDQTACPDEELLQDLFDRIYELSPKDEIPITKNCHGGVGRTAVTALGYYYYKKLKQSKTNIDDMEINIPKMICKVREYRKDLVGWPFHLMTIYSLLASQYLKRKK